MLRNMAQTESITGAINGLYVTLLCYFGVEMKYQESKERLIYNVTEDILVAIEQKGISKNDLARKISKSKSHVTQMLSGSRNMTLGTLSDICVALEIKLKIHLK